MQWIVYRITATALLLLLLQAKEAAAFDSKPFSIGNLSPLVQVYGLPALLDADVLAAGETQLSMSVNLANNFFMEAKGNERLVLDGEVQRYELGLRRGVGERSEIGLMLPLVGQRGGVLDGFIDEWHSFWGFDGGPRPTEAHDRLFYLYMRDGRPLLAFDDKGSGLGDLGLTGGFRLTGPARQGGSAVALRAMLKLATGSAAALRGSGAHDFSLALTMRDGSLPHNLVLHGAVGGLLLGRGDILPELQRRTVGFAMLCLVWQGGKATQLKLQLNGNTAFYRGSELAPLSGTALQVTLGGTKKVSDRYFVDLAVAEDLLPDTAPDVTCQVALRRVF